ncbi:MAG: hypothetical protein ACTSU2_15460 [Promethearchaeota archaeon]
MDLKPMPVEIFDENEFLEMAKKAEHCRVKRVGDVVKLKLRTKRKLIVLKTTPQKADMLIKKLSIDIQEFN